MREFLMMKMVYNILMSKQKQGLVINNKKKECKFKVRDKEISFSGNFDSGNLQKVEQLTPYIYRITSGNDKPRHSSKKSIFHFKVSGLRQCTITFLINKIDLLQQLITLENLSKIYHPVVRTKSQKTFQKIKDNVKLYYNMQNQPEMSFNYTFTLEQQTQFAFTYPYSYEDGQRFIKDITNTYSNHSNIKLKHRVLCTINDKFNVDIIKITNKDIIIDHEITKSDRFRHINTEKKPKVLITARVHPGESPSSFCVEGIIRYLLNEQDHRSFLLRKHFEFIIIPMLNPQAVFNGYFRSDINGYNLNRVYYCADQQLHKSIWSVKKQIEKTENIDFYFDLHGHSGLKDFFIYGNAFKELQSQVEAQVFGKIIEHNCPYFQNLNCIFTQSAMKSKDKYDKLTKEGCGRVFFHRKFSIIHSYTVQCGFFAPTKLHEYLDKPSQGISQTKYKQTKDWQQYSMGEYLPRNYMFLGKAILNSILDLFYLNPFSKLPVRPPYYMDYLRLFTAQKIFTEFQRFHFSDEHTIKKMKISPNIIEKKYYEKRFGYCGLSIIKKTPENTSIPKNENPFLNSQRKIHNQPRQVQGYNLIKSQTFSEQQKSQIFLPRMKNSHFGIKLQKVNSIQSKPQGQEEESQLIIGGVHGQIFKDFSKYNKNKEKEQRMRRKRTQTEAVNNKLTMRDFRGTKRSNFYQIQTSINLNSIKKEVFLHLLNKKVSPIKSSNTIKSNNFRIINGKESSKKISIYKIQQSSPKKSLQKLKTKH